MMLTRLLGFIWIVIGVLCLIKPDILRNYFKKKMSRKVKWTFFGFAFFFGIHLIRISFGTPGFLPQIAGLFGILMLIKGTLLITTKSIQNLTEWWVALPTYILRIWACGNIGAGLFLFYV